MFIGLVVDQREVLKRVRFENPIMSTARGDIKSHLIAENVTFFTNIKKISMMKRVFSSHMISLTNENTVFP